MASGSLRLASLLTIAALVVVSGSLVASEQRPELTEHRQLTDEDRRLLEAVVEMEAEINRLVGLTPSERFVEAAGLRRELERFHDRVSGTRYENQALFWLADWHYVYGDIDEVERLTRELAGRRAPALQAAGRALRARTLLRQGRTDEARVLAERLTAYAPEFAPLLERVAFHERVGQAAPRTSGQALRGEADPAAARSEPWLLYCFGNLGNPAQRFQIERMVRELAREAYAGRVRPVLVAFDGDPLGAMARAAEMPGGTGLDLIWANPNEGGDAARWRSAWGFNRLPVTVLIGPDRSVMAVDPDPARLRPLVGLEQDDDAGQDPDTSGLWRGARRGRYADH